MGRTMDDSIRVSCTKCKTVFRERAQPLQSGFFTQCPGCEIVMFFEESSNDPNIRRALAEARRTRSAIRERRRGEVLSLGIDPRGSAIVLRAKRRRRADSPEGDAGVPHHEPRIRCLAAGTVGESEAVTAAPARRRTNGGCTRSEGISGGIGGAVTMKVVMPRVIG